MDTTVSSLRTHELVNTRGDRVRLLDYGARIASLELQMDDGVRSVVLGYPTAQCFLDDSYYMGCTVGRYCNRIAGSRFTIGENEFCLAANEGRNQLHGGPEGFDRRLWRIEAGANHESVAFHLLSEHGDQGFPGRLEAAVVYRWSERRELGIEYTARTDQPTHVNLTNHAYFNLDAVHADVLQHRLQIEADRVVPVDGECIPTGELAAIAGTALDLRRARRVADVVGSAHAAIRAARGIDLNYVLNDAAHAAELWSSSGDLKLSVTTSYPGLQCYTGQHLAAPWHPYAGLCLEPQFFPDSPNRAQFPSTLLTPARTFRAYIRYRFSARAGDLLD